MKTNEELKQPVVIDPPAELWLVYGDLDEDCKHSDCSEVTWCENPAGFASDVKYVRADHALQPSGDVVSVARGDELRAALEKIRRMPAMPFPDAGAHSWEVFGKAVFGAWCDIQRTAQSALSQPSTVSEKVNSND